MTEVLRYKGYVGSIEYSQEDGLFCGKVLGIKSLISYEGNCAKELVADFQGAVDDYLILCEEEGSAPETAQIVPFNVQLEESALRRAAVYSENAGVSLNSFIARAIEEKIIRIDEAVRSAVRA